MHLGISGFAESKFNRMGGHAWGRVPDIFAPKQK